MDACDKKVCYCHKINALTLSKVQTNTKTILGDSAPNRISIAVLPKNMQELPG